ncbi:helix-turn-helix domain-containing protein [Membranihabitans maritimus]|uniref:helix-turn-helix domain-containing protein n=1 Tax=Membranihabitans maritimus TaxID=2904244 RepID=UPI001F491039|nr:helix-turn-helix domain-containing protein [Membranihabitans maritimus]
MSPSRTTIPYYREINDFLASTPFSNRTNNPDLFCLRIGGGDMVKKFYKPPFRRAFYFIGLLNNVENSQIIYDNMSAINWNSSLIFQAPGLISSYHHHDSAYGYLIYFTLNCFSFLKPELKKEFPFFDIRQTNFFGLEEKRFKEITPLFEDVFLSYEKSAGTHHPATSARLLALLYELKDFTDTRKWKDHLTNPQRVLLKKYTQLVNNNYIEKRTVEEYAEMLSVTPRHLSHSIKKSTGKKALSFIKERIATEAQSLILYTDLSISEICYQLNFSDPANFSKFFKKEVGLSPSQFRNQSMFKNL